ncbi:similar to Gifsy-1 prophage protein [Erwinia pyrifoliae Ep1/96]|nr:similar to Gifsy-1 prophage protein [Erwinia pyrifoliae Ep1/96]
MLRSQRFLSIPKLDYICDHVMEENMLAIHNLNRIETAVVKHVNCANVEGKPTFVASVSSVENVSTDMLKPKIFAQCVILNNLHVPQNIPDTDIEGYNKGMQVRINQEYQPQGKTVFLLGSPEVLEPDESLSLPASPHILAQKLSSIANIKACAFSFESNGYVQRSEDNFIYRNGTSLPL